MKTSLFDETKQTQWFVTESGAVFRITNGVKFQKGVSVHSRGYVYVRTTNGNYQLHRLVATAFLSNDKNKQTVNHKDGNKQNNSVENLEWATYKENAQHALRRGLTTRMGKNEGNLKYTNQQCLDILALIKGGETYKKAGEVFGMPYSTVAHLVRGSRRCV